MVNNDDIDVVVVVPYRDREEHKSYFIEHMPNILEDKKYEIIFVHQCDTRPFNRGAMKNIGLLYLKQNYPDYYKNITIVFNDIDNMPKLKNQFDYNTTSGIIKHYYGYKHTLGGIFAINAGDFEKINGFANIWTWGLEDNILLKRSTESGIEIMRDKMIVINDKKTDDIITLDHGNFRYVSDYIQNKYYYDNGFDGIQSLSDVNFNVVDINKNIKEVRVNSFNTPEPLDSLFIKSAKNIDVSKRPINFEKKFIVGNDNKLYIPQPVNKKTMLFNTFKKYNNTNITNNTKPRTSKSNYIFKIYNNNSYKKKLLF